MTAIAWGVDDQSVEFGVDRGVLYLAGTGYAWNGLRSVDEKDDSSIDTSLYFDGVRHRLAQDTGNYSAEVVAYYYPEAFEDYEDASGLPFGFSYRTMLGEGYRLHLVYNVRASISTRTHGSWAKAGTTEDLAWNFYSTPVEIPGAKAASHIFVDTREAKTSVVEELERVLYEEGRMPSPAEVVDIFEQATKLRVTYNSDGTWTATGPDELISEVDGVFVMTAENLFYESDGVYVVQSEL